MKILLKILILITLFFVCSPACPQNSASSLETVEVNEDNLPEETPVIEKEVEIYFPINLESDQKPENSADKPKSILEMSSEELEKYEKFVEADNLYLEGEIYAAEKIYRELKPPFEAELKGEIKPKLDPIYDPQKLDPQGAVYWKLYQQGLKNDKLLSKRLIPLKFLVEQQPHFIPAYIYYAQLLEDQDQDQEALKILQQALTLYPDDAKLLKAKIEEDEEEERWLEAAISAHQFAMFNPNHPEVEEFKQLAEENLNRYRQKLKSDLSLKAFGNVLTGGLTYALTGSLFGPLSAMETIMLLLQGESAVGDSIAKSVRQQVPMVKDEEVVTYVRDIGDKLIQVTQRDDLEYEFYVVMEESINAFALPGGKIFVNAGAILETDSEAELAGLLAHELSHAILSHSFQMVTQSNLTANVVLFIPYVGNTATNLIVLNYSREMETEADVLGTKILVASGYAADGVRNLMLKIDQQENENQKPPPWLSTHPESQARVEYLEELIVSDELNRYSYEGVQRHWQIKQKVHQLLTEYEHQQQE